MDPMYELIFWGALFVVLIVAESITVQLVSIWFALGSAVAFIAALFHAPLVIQILSFVISSVILLLATRSITNKVRPKTQPTNADAVIGKSGLVIDEIDNVKTQGRIRIDGLTWNARSTDSEIIPVGEKVRVQKLEGVTVYVTLISEHQLEVTP